MLSNISLKKKINKIKPLISIKCSFVVDDGTSKIIYRLGKIMHNAPKSPIHGFIWFKMSLNCMMIVVLKSILMLFSLLFVNVNIMSNTILFWNGCYEVELLCHEIFIMIEYTSICLNNQKLLLY